MRIGTEAVDLEGSGCLDPDRAVGVVNDRVLRLVPDPRVTRSESRRSCNQHERRDKTSDHHGILLYFSPLRHLGSIGAIATWMPADTVIAPQRSVRHTR